MGKPPVYRCPGQRMSRAWSQRDCQCILSQFGQLKVPEIGEGEVSTLFFMVKQPEGSCRSTAKIYRKVVFETSLFFGNWAGAWKTIIHFSKSDNICYIPKTWKTIIHSSKIDDLEPLYTKYWPWPKTCSTHPVMKGFEMDIMVDPLHCHKPPNGNNAATIDLYANVTASW